MEFPFQLFKVHCIYLVSLLRRFKLVIGWPWGRPRWPRWEHTCCLGLLEGMMGMKDEPCLGITIKMYQDVWNFSKVLLGKGFLLDPMSSDIVVLECTDSKIHINCSSQCWWILQPLQRFEVLEKIGDTQKACKTRGFEAKAIVLPWGNHDFSYQYISTKLLLLCRASGLLVRFSIYKDQCFAVK